jgi:16S rRNA (guanine527-N7)-methyltransferase
MHEDGESRQETETAVFSLIEAGLTELAVRADERPLAQLTRLVLLLSEWAARINLTGHRDPLQLTAHLVMDAVALSQALPELDTVSRLADLGSGAGFPGLPVAILHPDLEVVLVESRLKRHHFQREARRKLGLSNVVPILGRSDEIEVRPSDMVVAQAMAQPALALALMRPWARPGGWVVLPASAGAEEPQHPEGLVESSLREYVVPGTGRLRRLWLARVEKS